MRDLIDDTKRRALVAAVQTGVAAGLSWWIAQLLLSSARPLYAPVAAVVVIGAGFERRVERGVAMISGMALAIVLSEVGVRMLGSGAVQIAALTALAIVVARVVLSDLTAVSYAGLNAAILVALGGEGWVPDRLLEAAVGAAVAYGLVYLVFPPRPSFHVRQAVDAQVAVAGSSMRRVAQALRAADPDRAYEADRGSDGVDRKVEELASTFDFSQQVSRLSPWRRKERPATTRLRERAGELQSVLRDATALVRVAGWQVQHQRTADEHLARAITLLAEAVEEVGHLVTIPGVEVDGQVRERFERIHELVTAAAVHAGAECTSAGDGHVATVEAVRTLIEHIRQLTDRLAGGRRLAVSSAAR